MDVHPLLAILLALCLPLASGCLSEEVRPASTSDGVPSETQGNASVLEAEHETVQHTFVEPANAHAGNLIVHISSWEAFGPSPKNTTGVKVEVVYDAPMAGTGVSPINVSAGSNDHLNGTTLEGPGPKAFRVPSSLWSWNTSSSPLWISVYPEDSSVVAAAQIHVYATLFEGGPPDWSYSAVE